MYTLPTRELDSFLACVGNSINPEDSMYFPFNSLLCMVRSIWREGDKLFTLIGSFFELFDLPNHQNEDVFQLLL